MKTGNTDLNTKKPADNNFTLLRLIAAFFVLISHSFGILDKGLQQPHVTINRQVFVASDVGMAVFFTISGYLVTQSLFNARSYNHYLWKRFIRIVPALVVVNIACMILGACITTLPIKEYVSNSATWLYFLKNSTLVNNQFVLPGVFTTLREQSINASLWTIVVEVRFYIALLIGKMLGIFKNKWLLLSFFILFEAANLYTSLTKWTLPGIDLEVYFIFGTSFFTGVLISRFKKVISFSWQPALLLLAIALLTSGTAIWFLTAAVFTSYLIIVIGETKAIVRLNGWDISYGFYLYAFPVQQLLLLYFGYDVNVWLHIVISCVITAVFAILSWRQIEQPALKKKNLFVIKQENVKTV